MGDTGLMKKLQLKPGQAILLINPPGGFQEQLAGLEWATEADGRYDSVHLFVYDSQELNRLATPAIQALKPDGRLWIAYPKLSSGVGSDLTRDAGWEAVFQAGFRPVTQVAIDETWSALRFKPTPHATGEELAAAQFKGAKAGLRPIYEQIMAVVQGFGPDVVVNPRETYIALARKKQFAVLKASTSARFDLGLRLEAAPQSDRLAPAQGLGSGSINWKVSLTGVEQVDAELSGWLRAAYDEAG
jgi:hypothetical protein